MIFAPEGRGNIPSLPISLSAPGRALSLGRQLSDQMFKMIVLEVKAQGAGLFLWLAAMDGAQSSLPNTQGIGSRGREEVSSLRPEAGPDKRLLPALMCGLWCCASWRQLVPAGAAFFLDPSCPSCLAPSLILVLLSGALLLETQPLRAQPGRAQCQGATTWRMRR